MTADLAPTRTGTAALGGVRLAFREHGEPGDPPVVLLHGGFSRASTWDTFAAALAEAGRHAIALELRGHGGSSHPGEYSISLMADDLAAFLDRRGWRGWTWLGTRSAASWRGGARFSGRIGWAGWSLRTRAVG